MDGGDKGQINRAAMTGASVGAGFAVEFRILGPLDVLDGSRVVSLRGQRKRAALAILLLHLNQVVSAERVIDELWGERAPPTALQTVRVFVSQIRKALGSDLVRTLPGGYALDLAHQCLFSRPSGPTAMAAERVIDAVAVLEIT